MGTLDLREALGVSASVSEFVVEFSESEGVVRGVSVPMVSLFGEEDPQARVPTRARVRAKRAMVLALTITRSVN